MNEGMAKAQMSTGVLGAAASGQYAANRPTPSGDSFTGQMIHLDELIKQQSEILTRLTTIADLLAPGEDRDAKTNAIGQISPGPDSGPLLFRIQNRTRDLSIAQTKVFAQINRIQEVL